jgi:hypothetical protein
MGKSTSSNKYLSPLYPITVNVLTCHRKSTKSSSSKRSTQEPRLDHDTQSRIPNGPSNVEMYVSREETWEHIAMGHPTYRDQEAMASGLERELADYQVAAVGHPTSWPGKWCAHSGRSGECACACAVTANTVCEPCDSEPADCSG